MPNLIFLHSHVTKYKKCKNREFLNMFKTLIKGLMMIRGVRVIVGIVFVQVGTRFG